MLATRATSRWFTRILGAFVFIAGIAFAVWVGVYFFLCCGILEALHAAQASPVNDPGLVQGIFRALVFETAGGITGWVAVFIGLFLWTWSGE